MKVLFYQSNDEKLSINLLFKIIKEHLPPTLQQSTIYLTYNGASSLARIHDILSAAFRRNNHLTHVTGDFNYVTLLMPKSKTILTIHDLYRLYLHEGSRFKAFIFKWCWLRLPIARAGVVTAVSEYTKKEIIKYSRCSPSKVRVIYNCISTDFHNRPKPFNKTKPVLLQVGTRANKNLDRLAEAIMGISCRLQIVGEPNPQTIALLHRYNIDYSWKVGLSAAAVLTQYEECDMLVFASTYEGFGMPIVEANAVGRPVVTGNISAMAEIAANAACLVDPFDISSIRAGILKVIEDDDYRQQLVSAGLANSQRFKAKKIANDYYNLYQELYNKVDRN